MSDRDPSELKKRLIENYRVKPFQILQAEAFLHNMKVIDLDSHPPSLEALHMLPAGVARGHRVIPVAHTTDPSGQQTLVVAIEDPTDAAALDAASAACEARIQPILAARDQISHALETFYAQDEAAET